MLPPFSDLQETYPSLVMKLVCFHCAMHSSETLKSAWVGNKKKSDYGDGAGPQENKGCPPHHHRAHGLTGSLLAGQVPEASAFTSFLSFFSVHFLKNVLHLLTQVNPKHCWRQNHRTKAVLLQVHRQKAGVLGKDSRAGTRGSPSTSCTDSVRKPRA